MKLLSLAPLCLTVVLLGVACALPRAAPSTGNIPASLHLVWRLETNLLHASACPVRILKNGTVLFLTAKHAFRNMDTGFVQSRDKQRKLTVLSHIEHPTADLAAFVVEGDGEPVILYTLNLQGCSIGDRVYTSGFPGPLLHWFGYEGFLGMVGHHSAIIEIGMSGGPLVDAKGSLVGILRGHAVRFDEMGKTTRNLPNQAISGMLHLHQEWLRQVGVIE